MLAESFCWQAIPDLPDRGPALQEAGDVLLLVQGLSWRWTAWWSCLESQFQVGNPVIGTRPDFMLILGTP